MTQFITSPKDIEELEFFFGKQWSTQPELRINSLHDIHANKFNKIITAPADRGRGPAEIDKEKQEAQEQLQKLKKWFNILKHQQTKKLLIQEYKEHNAAARPSTHSLNKRPK